MQLQDALLLLLLLLSVLQQSYRMQQQQYARVPGYELHTFILYTASSHALVTAYTACSYALVIAPATFKHTHCTSNDWWFRVPRGCRSAASRAFAASAPASQARTPTGLQARGVW
ncbi:hypothetical protein COO60DRAFT_1583164 [Scenedesmus sp. NREL 46B-D3]|nr:hypothetical protein COO60DRAFT_1583164 [Scenedesmus sp. NREL 46B-D3]